MQVLTSSSCNILTRQDNEIVLFMTGDRKPDFWTHVKQLETVPLVICFDLAIFSTLFISWVVSIMLRGFAIIVIVIVSLLLVTVTFFFPVVFIFLLITTILLVRLFNTFLVSHLNIFAKIFIHRLLVVFSLRTSL